MPHGKGTGVTTSLCVITARGGSKRIPRKNIREFCGKPIIAYSIEAALMSGLFSEVMVSTDDEEIAKVSTSFGAEVPFMRNARTSDDHSTTLDVLNEVLREYCARGKEFDELCCIYPTAPFVTADKLREAHSMLDGADTVLPVVRFSFPPQRGLVGDENALAWWQPECANARSQDLPAVFHDAGQFYFCRPDRLLAGGELLGSVTRGYEVPETEAQDIDNESDWEVAEMKYERMVEHGKV